jgi:hypothetical protein
MPTNISGTTGITLPSTAAPVFSAYLTSNQSFSNNTWTKITLNAETFDTNSNFDSSTNYRFTPTVAGYYQMNACIWQNWGSGQFSVCSISFYKNGTSYKLSQWNTSSLYGMQTLSDVIYFNGSTDYVELYVNQNGGSGPTAIGGSANTWMSGAFIRSA